MFIVESRKFSEFGIPRENLRIIYNTNKNNEI